MKWIDINQIKPKENKNVLLYSKSNSITVLGSIYKNYSDNYLVNSSSVIIGTPLEIFTHWAEVPKRP
jgi:hypothetical protein